MTRISDPARIDHIERRQMAVFAEWVAKLEEATELLEHVFLNISGASADEEVPPSSPREEFETIDLVLALTSTTFEEMDQELEGRVGEWFSRDPEHWPIFRLVVIDPWRTKAGRWRADTPGWVHARSTNTIAAHFQQLLYGRRRIVDWDNLA